MYKHILISTDGSEISQGGPRAGHGEERGRQGHPRCRVDRFRSMQVPPAGLPPPMATAEYEASQKAAIGRWPMPRPRPTGSASTPRTSTSRRHTPPRPARRYFCRQTPLRRHRHGLARPPRSSPPSARQRTIEVLTTQPGSGSGGPVAQSGSGCSQPPPSGSTAAGNRSGSARLCCTAPLRRHRATVLRAERNP